VAQLEALQRDTSKQIADLKTQLSNEIKLKNTSEEQLDQAQAQRDEFKSQVAQSSTARSSEASANAKEVKTLKDAIFSLNKEKDDLAGKVATLTNQNNEMRKNVAALDSNAKGSNMSEMQMKQKLDTETKEVEALKAEKRQMTNELNTLRGKVDSENKARSKMDTDMKAIKLQWEKEVAGLKATIVDLTKDRDVTKEANKKFDAANTELKSKNADLDAKLRAATAKIQDLNKQLNAIVAQNNKGSKIVSPLAPKATSRINAGSPAAKSPTSAASPAAKKTAPRSATMTKATTPTRSSSTSATRGAKTSSFRSPTRPSPSKAKQPEPEPEQVDEVQQEDMIGEEIQQQEEEEMMEGEGEEMMEGEELAEQPSEEN